MRTIVIEIEEGNSFTLREGDRYCEGLCWDEMLGSIAELTHSKLGAMRYPMRTQAEHDAEEARRQRRIAERLAAQEAGGAGTEHPISF